MSLRFWICSYLTSKISRYPSSLSKPKGKRLSLLHKHKICCHLIVPNLLPPLPLGLPSTIAWSGLSALSLSFFHCKSVFIVFWYAISLNLCECVYSVLYRCPGVVLSFDFLLLRWGEMRWGEVRLAETEREVWEKRTKRFGRAGREEMEEKGKQQTWNFLEADC